MKDVLSKMEELLNSQDALIEKLRRAINESEMELKRCQRNGGKI